MTTRTAKTYGGALYDLAKEEHLDDALLQDLALVRAVLKDEPNYMRLLCTPSVSKQERRALLDEAWRDRVHPYVLNFMKLLCDNGTLRELPGCADEYRRRYNADHDILEVRAVTAVALRPELQDKLRERLEKLTGKRIPVVSDHPYALEEPSVGRRGKKVKPVGRPEKGAPEADMDREDASGEKQAEKPKKPAQKQERAKKSAEKTERAEKAPQAEKPAEKSERTEKTPRADKPERAEAPARTPRQE